MTQMTEAHRAALLSAPQRRAGVIATTTPAAVRADLFRAGLIGPGDGLTERGFIVRRRLYAAMLDAAF